MHLIIRKRPMGQYRSLIISFSQSILSRLAGIYHYNVAHTYIPHLVKSGEDSCAGVVPEHNIKAHISFLFW